MIVGTIMLRDFQNTKFNVCMIVCNKPQLAQCPSYSSCTVGRKNVLISIISTDEEHLNQSIVKTESGFNLYSSSGLLTQLMLSLLK